MLTFIKLPHRWTNILHNFFYLKSARDAEVPPDLKNLGHILTILEHKMVYLKSILCERFYFVNSLNEIESLIKPK